MKWKPIETAPQDGRTVRVRDKDLRDNYARFLHGKLHVLRLWRTEELVEWAETGWNEDQSLPANREVVTAKDVMALWFNQGQRDELERAGLVLEKRDPFLAPLTSPTRYFDGQEDLIRVLKCVGLEPRGLITTVHLVARALAKGGT